MASEFFLSVDLLRSYYTVILGIRGNCCARAEYEDLNINEFGRLIDYSFCKV